MSKKNAVKKVNGKKSDLTAVQMRKLAKDGTKEAMAKLETFAARAEGEQKAAAELALRDCRFNYYDPKNEKESKEFLLAKLIMDKKGYVFSLMEKIATQESRMDKFRLEMDVHKKVLAANKDKREDWQYREVEDFLAMEQGRLDELKDDLDYAQAWIAAAGKMTATPRYKAGIPEDILEEVVWDFEDEIEEDECCSGDDDWDDGCCCGDDDDSVSCCGDFGREEIREEDLPL